MNNGYNEGQNGQPVNYYQIAPTETKKKSGSKIWLGIFIGVLVTAIMAGAVGFAAYGLGVRAGIAHGNSSSTATANNNNANDIESDVGDIIDNLKDSPVTDTTVPADPNARLSYAQVAEKLQPSVCTVLSYYYRSSYGGGSGIILSDDGYIVTNAHVIYDEDYPDLRITVKVYGHEGEYPAEVIGYDEKSDVALLKIEVTGLIAAEIGNSNALVVGDEVVAIGTPLDEAYAGTVTNGIVSGLDRVIDDTETATKYIQTNAAINPGNSGGPLVNMYGQVIGINTAKIVMDGYEGMGFAIPMDSILDIIEQLRNKGYIERPALGMKCQTVDEDESTYYGIPQGVRIVSLAGNSDLVGKVEIYDIITEIDGVTITSIGDLTLILNEHKVDDVIELTLYRKKKSETEEAMTYKVQVQLLGDSVISYETEITE